MGSCRKLRALFRFTGRRFAINAALTGSSVVVAAILFIGGYEIYQSRRYDQWKAAYQRLMQRYDTLTIPSPNEVLLWEYRPHVAWENKFRSVNLLLDSFEVAGAPQACYDLVHTHTPLPAVVARLLLPRSSGVRIVHTEHHMWQRYRLPMDAKYRNPKIGALAPIRVVNEVLATGDGAHGVRTAAFNLPNDERVVRAYGSKRVMLKNVQEAKFSKILEPIAARVLGSADRAHLSFNAFFTHILAHEMTHGIGPQNNVRASLKELHSAIEEAKADATGLFLLQYLYDQKLLPAQETELYTTFLASAFRTLRFGVHEAHGRGMALQFNYLTDKGAFVANADGTFSVDLSKVKDAVRDLVHELLTVEAANDYNGAKKMLEELGVLRPALQQALAKLADLPTDIEPLRQ